MSHLLIFAAVVGSLLAFGLVGLFVGPVVLALAYTLLDDWTNAVPSPEAALPGEQAARRSPAYPRPTRRTIQPPSITVARPTVADRP
jgi:hypothetical protein